MSEPMRVLFDTRGYWATLRAAGIPEVQADAIVNGLDRALHQGVATHDDIVALNGHMDGLNNRMDAMENRLIVKLGAMMTGLIAVATGVIVMVSKLH